MTTSALPAAFRLDSRYSWFRLGVSVVLSIVGCAGMWVVILVLPRVQGDFAVSRSEISLAYTATMIGWAVGNVIFGRLVDRTSISTSAVGAALLLALGYYLASISTSLWAFTLVQCVLIGMGTSLSFGPLMADISHWFEKRRGIAISIAACGNYVAGSFWSLALQPVLEADGWRGAYLVLALASIFIMLPLAFLLRRPPPHRNSAGGGSSYAPPTHAIDMSPRLLVVLLALAGLCCCVAMSMPQVHIVAYCFDLGYGVAVGDKMLSLMLMGGIASRVLSGFLADRIGGVRTLLIGSMLQCLALFLYLPFDGLASLYVVSIVFGLSQGGIVPSYAVIVREYLPAQVAGERVGLVIMMTVIGMALGGWMSGVIYDLTGSYQAAFINGIVWNAVNITIMLIVLWRTTASPPATVPPGR